MAKQHWSDKVRRIFETRECSKVEKVYCDITTASMLCAVIDGLSPENAEKFKSFDFFKAVTVGWKLCK